MFLQSSCHPGFWCVNITFFISTLSFLYAHRAFCSFEVLVYELIMDIAASVLNFSAFRDMTSPQFYCWFLLIQGLSTSSPVHSEASAGPHGCDMSSSYHLWDCPEAQCLSAFARTAALWAWVTRHDLKQQHFEIALLSFCCTYRLFATLAWFPDHNSIKNSKQKIVFLSFFVSDSNWISISALPCT